MFIICYGYNPGACISGEVVEMVEGDIRGTAYVPLWQAEEILDKNLPVADLRHVYTRDHDGAYQEMTTKRGVYINEQPYEVVSDRYSLVQHKDAFKPVCEVLAGVSLELKVKVSWYGDAAYMSVIVDDDIADSVRYGFYVSNVHDGIHAVTYSYAMTRVQKYKEMVTHKTTHEIGDNDDTRATKGGYTYVELVGFRQVCANGMKIRVPLQDVITAGAKASELQMSVKKMLTEVWASEEERVRLKRLLNIKQKIAHKGDVQKKLEEQKRVMEVLIALRNPVKRLIERAQNKHVGPREGLAVLESYLGKTATTKITQLVADGDVDPLVSAWDVYNAMTYFATHKADSVRTINRVENASADYLVMLSRSLAKEVE